MAHDVVAVEEPLQIRLDDGSGARALAVTMRTPGQDEALALGFLFTEGIIPGTAAVASVTLGDPADAETRNTVTVALHPSCPVDWPRLQRHSYTSSSCGVCGKAALEQVFQALPFGEMPGDWRVPAELISALPRRLRAAQALFAATGGIHAAGLFDATGELLLLAEDVGRHNALDKVIGQCLRPDELPLSQRILVLSGRASFELLQKAAMAGIEFVVSVGAPSSLAVALATDQGITLCGFVREAGFNCYATPERLLAAG
ncbi:formate dehydrogenase accessory sulfurtransferase FdhD [Lewinella lacunae]|uniref:Sulfur carrier protein FdhD n=2 Tax=Neolewinella lacunae TaxID=1517758 RepID=A0A923PLC2_9BACT|nr:formate dehydrogenase accessory sulfurtransferase FdhD [Neolewinella lacunae]